MSPPPPALACLAAAVVVAAAAVVVAAASAAATSHLSTRLERANHRQVARTVPPHRRTRFLSSRASILDTFTCPKSQSRTCPQGNLCCENQCCPATLPQCSSKGFCTDGKGNGLCVDSVGTQLVGQTCNDKDALCCLDPNYPFCSAGTNISCVNAEGYINCGAKKEPGVLCNDEGGCCTNPSRCCGDKCCETGSGGPLPTRSPLQDTLTPAATLGARTSISPAESSSASQKIATTCFPGSATVELQDGRTVRLSDVRVGDRVRVSASEFGDIFMWTHRDASHTSDAYVSLVTHDEHELTAAVGHMVYVCRGAKGGCARVVAGVEDVAVGDGLWVVRGDGLQVSTVVRKRKVRASGLYNPQTMEGDVVVNGVVATCYTRFLPIRVAHSLLVPLRWAYGVVNGAAGAAL